MPTMNEAKLHFGTRICCFVCFIHAVWHQMYVTRWHPFPSALWLKLIAYQLLWYSQLSQPCKLVMPFLFHYTSFSTLFMMWNSSALGSEVYILVGGGFMICLMNSLYVRVSVLIIHVCYSQQRKYVGTFFVQQIACNLQAFKMHLVFTEWAFTFLLLLFVC